MVLIVENKARFTRALFLYYISKYKIHFEKCLASAPNSSRRFGPANEVKERLHCQALQRLSELSSPLRFSLIMQQSYCFLQGNQLLFSIEGRL
jgi:hypothetical protein